MSKINVSVNSTPAILSADTSFSDLLGIVKSLPVKKTWDSVNKVWHVSGDENAINEHLSENNVSIIDEKNYITKPKTGDTELAKYKNSDQYIVPSGAYTQTELLDLTINVNSMIEGEREEILLKIIAVMKLFQGRVSGKKTIVDESGNRIITATSFSKDKGDLTPDEALLVLSKADQFNIDPARLHVLFNNSLQILLPFYIELGLCNTEAKIRGEEYDTYTPDPQEKNGDIMSFTYIWKKTEQNDTIYNLVFSSILKEKEQSGESPLNRVLMAKLAASEAVSSYKGIGIVSKSELTRKDGKKRTCQVTGKDWAWVAKKRSKMDAMRRMYPPSPLAISTYKNEFDNNNILLVNDPDYQHRPDMSLDEHQRMINLIKQKNNPNSISKKIPFENRVNILRGKEEESNEID